MTLGHRVLSKALGLEANPKVADENPWGSALAQNFEHIFMWTRVALKIILSVAFSRSAILGKTRAI